MWRRALIVVAVLVTVYVAAYLALSRRGYAEADRYGFVGFYYFTPENSGWWRVKHFGCTDLFAPLNSLDRELGTGRYPAKEPLWGLSR